MSFFKSLGIKVMALAIAFSLAPSTMPSGTPVPGIGVSVAKADSHYRGYRGGGRHYRGSRHYGGRRYYGGRRHYRSGRYYGHRRHGHGDAAAAAVIGGIVGLGLGAALASPRPVAPRPIYRARPVVRGYGAPRPWTGEWYRYCASRYRSFDARSGTFQPYRGPRQLCR